MLAPRKPPLRDVGRERHHPAAMDAQAVLRRRGMWSKLSPPQGRGQLVGDDVGDTAPGGLARLAWYRREWRSPRASSRSRWSSGSRPAGATASSAWPVGWADAPSEGPGTEMPGPTGTGRGDGSRTTTGQPSKLSVRSRWVMPAGHGPVAGSTAALEQEEGRAPPVIRPLLHAELQDCLWTSAGPGRLRWSLQSDDGDETCRAGDEGDESE